MVQKRRLLFSAAALIVIVFAAFLVLNIKKSKIPLSIGQSKSGSISSLLAQAKSLEMAGSFSEAKEAYQKLVNDFSNSG